MVLSLLQPENIEDISVTFAVLKLLKSREERLLQPENIDDISVTFAVLKLLKSREERLLQPENIDDISVTFSVLKNSFIPTISIRLSQPANHNELLLGV